MRQVRVRRHNPTHDPVSELAEPDHLEERRAVLVAAPPGKATPRAWLAIGAYDGNEGTLLFCAPVGDDSHGYVRALLAAAIDEARLLGFTSLLAHWRAGWASAEPVLDELGFATADEGLWRRAL